MFDLLLEPLSEPFFVRALLAVALGGVTCACLGAYVVLRRMAFVSTALTHSILPGVVGALLLGFSPYLGALAAALLTAGGAAWLAARKGASEDSAIGVMLSVMFAAGVALMQQANSWRDFAGLLFGLRVLHKELELASFDEEYASLLGARPGLMRVVLLALVALGAVSCVSLVGALLTTALFVIPAATGVLLGRTVPQVMAWGVGCALAGGVAGLYLSYYLPAVPSGAGIVLCCALPYLLARLFAPRR